jgi:hypothetical protein
MNNKRRENREIKRKLIFESENKPKAMPRF